MCFQDAATGFSLRAQIHPNYSHFEVSSTVKTFSHDAASVTYILITHLPESQPATQPQQLFSGYSTTLHCTGGFFHAASRASVFKVIAEKSMTSSRGSVCLTDDGAPASLLDTSKVSMLLQILMLYLGHIKQMFMNA